LVLDLFHRLEEAGHRPIHTPQPLTELKMDPQRVRQLVKKTEADAWIVNAASREVLAWFAEQSIPTFALFGRRDGLSLAAAGPDKPATLIKATQRLLELGHHRIVYLVFEERRIPEPGVSERAFLDTLESHGIRTGAYNLPQWEDSAEGLQEILTSLFLLTPPTALIIDTPQRLFVPVREFLAQRGLRVPEDVSLICTDDSPTFAWSNPSIAHITWSHRPVVRRIERWADNISQGREDVKHTLTKATFVDGGTVGPVRE
jgi:DNA-binding LacI/PurR family transcriptional regulator